MKKILILSLMIMAISCGSKDGSNGTKNPSSQETVKIINSAIGAKSVDSQDKVVLDGQLQQQVHIGGEHTGYALYRGGNRVVELDLATHGLEKDFKELLFVEVTGTYVEVEGVERGPYLVFVVEDMQEPDSPHIE